jgi:hypothetical protein
MFVDFVPLSAMIIKPPQYSATRCSVEDFCQKNVGSGLHIPQKKHRKNYFTLATVDFHRGGHDDYFFLSKG